MQQAGMPLSGIRVLDFGHTVMGPVAGLVMADLGADVVKIEPPEGDRTRRLQGFGTGYFSFYNRNKRSLAIDLKAPEARPVMERLLSGADVLIENFGPGTMARLGLDPEELTERHERLIYLSLKGFLPGPYEDRPALDEVVQMMSGLAYMTGPPGAPLRAGASVIDIMGGVMGVVGVLAALRERETTGRGQIVSSALFESAAFLMGQHMACAATSGAPVPPMPARVSAWAIYDQFETADGVRVFLGITSDGQWKRFCRAIGREDLAEDPALATNNQRIAARERLIPLVRDLLASQPAAAIEEIALAAQLPFARIARPEDLFDDPHLVAGGRLLDTVLQGGGCAPLPGEPMEIGGRRTALRHQPPEIGADTRACLEEAGLSAAEISRLAERGVIRIGEGLT